MVKLNLETTGNYEVYTINESRKAFDAVRAYEPDIILLDVVMPEVDGGDVANQIRNHADTSRIPIIFVSAMVSRKESGSGFYNSGGEHFLAKPVSTELLTHAIEHVLTKN